MVAPVKLPPVLINKGPALSQERFDTLKNFVKQSYDLAWNDSLIVNRQDLVSLLQTENLLQKASTPSQSNLRDHMTAEFNYMRAHDDSVDNLEQGYQEVIYSAVSDLMEVFISQGHSGLSAAITLDIFSKLAQFETFQPITDDPSEWVNHGDFYQNRKQSDVFRVEGSKYWYTVNKPRVLTKYIPKWLKKQIPMHWKNKAGKIAPAGPGPKRGM